VAGKSRRNRTDKNPELPVVERNPSCSAPTKTAKKSLLGRGRLPVIVGVCAAVAAVLIGAVLAFKEFNRRDSGDSDAGVNKNGKNPVRGKQAAPAERLPDGRPKVEIFACTVLTNPPGFMVLVDGELARDEQGQLLKTPCVIGIPKGDRVLMIVQEKFRDQSEKISVTQSQKFEFSGVYQPFAEATGFFASPLSLPEIGEPVELAAVNAGGPGWDPWISSDGLSLWFAGQKVDGKGVYVSRRKALFEEFGAPELVIRHSERPGSPSATADGLIVSYSLPAKGQVRSLARNDAGLPFKAGPILRTTELDDDVWPSSQILGNGKTLFFTMIRKDRLTGRVVQRKTLRKSFEGTAGTARLLGGHPRFAADGLRQFWIEGKRLMRARRADLDSTFAEPESIVEFQNEVFTPQDNFRQYWVSEDEQWLYFGDDPQGPGRLFVARVSNGPRWGYAPIGKALEVPHSEEPAATLPGLGTLAKDEERAPEEIVATPPVDPRAISLPYAMFHEEFEKRIHEADYSGATGLLATAFKDPELTSAQEPLTWDQQELTRIIAFHERVEDAFRQMKPGDLIKSGASQIEFESFELGVVAGKTKGNGKPVNKPIAEFAPTDLVGVVDKRVDRQDAAAQIEIATFLLHSPKVSAPALQSRLDRAGERGKELAERASARTLYLIEQEIARNNIGVAIDRINKLVAAAPKSRSSQQARDLSQSLYTRISWTKVGNQAWESPTAGEFITAGTKSPGAILVAPDEYRNFLLELEWKTAGETSQGGVYFHYNDRGNLRKNAYKIHLIGDFAQRQQPDKFSTGSLFGSQAPQSNPVKPNGDWNTLSLRVEEDRVRVKINGVDVLESHLESKDVPARGLVCLDGEFTGISYRKVLLYELVSK
jgi:hypothetical protein